MLGRMMPRMRPPEDCEAMLRSMDPVNDEIDHEDSEPDSHHQRQFFQMRWNCSDSCHVATRDLGDQTSTDAVGNDREEEGKHVQLQLTPPVSLAGGSKSLPKLENQHQ